MTRVGDAARAGVDEPLTTKEGWRRFVDRQSRPPGAAQRPPNCCASPGERADYDETRRDYHADLPLVNTPTIQQVINTARLLVQLNRQQISARRGVIVSGASGTGKTTALTQLGRTHERPSANGIPAEKHRLPVALRHRPARGDGADAGHGVRPVPRPGVLRPGEHHRHRQRGLRHRRRHAGRAGAVDEMHNLNLATRTGAEVSDQLKYFAERLPATFVYAGIDVEAQGLFAGVRGRQIAGRFTLIPATPVRLRHQHPTRPMAGADRHLGIPPAPAPATAPAAWSRLDEYLYHRSGGMIGSLSQLMRGAAILAIEDGSEQITHKLLERVPVDYAAATRRHRIPATTPCKPRTWPPSERS